MGRIRTVKPDLLRHEGLQDMEKAYPEARPMLVFIGLFTVCDRMGRFEWRPRHLHLDILPFLDFSMESTLALLEQADYLRRYTVDGKNYGFIPTWKKHQRITGKEATDPPRYPAPPSPGTAGEIPGVSQGNIDAPKVQKARPGRKPREKKPEDAALALQLPPHLEPWFEAIWFEVWPEKVICEGELVKVERGLKGKARERFGLLSKQFTPVALYMAARGYIKNHQKVKDGYVQTVSTFFGTGKATYKDYLESALPYLEVHPTLAALKLPPESEEAFKALIRKDEVAHV